MSPSRISKKKGNDKKLTQSNPTTHRLLRVASVLKGGWSGGAMVLGKLPVPERPTYLDRSRARADCTCSGCGWGLLDIFTLVYHFSFLSPALSETARYSLVGWLIWV